MLVSGPDDAAGFADAIAELMADRDLRRRIIQEAYDVATARHSWPHFREIVATELTVGGVPAVPSLAGAAADVLAALTVRPPDRIERVQIRELSISGSYEITPVLRADDRGCFLRVVPLRPPC